MNPKLDLTSDKILNKEFPGVARGYDPLVVDQFLDDILKDYELIESNILLSKHDFEELKKEIVDLQKINRNLEIENGKYKARFENIKDNDVVNSDNINLVKRINALEKFLYKIGYNPNLIK